MIKCNLYIKIIITVLLIFLNISKMHSNISNKAYLKNQSTSITETVNKFNKLVKKDSLYFTFLENITSEYEFINIDSSLFYAYLHLKLADSINSDYERMRAYNSIGNAYQTLTKDSIAISKYNVAFEIAKKLKDNKYLYRLTSCIGLSYKNLDNVNKSIEFAHFSYLYAKQSKNQNLIGSALINLGVLYNSLNKFDEAIDYFFKALDVFTKQKNQKKISKICTSIGQIYKKIKDYPRSLYYLQLSYNIEKELYKDIKQKRAFQYGENIYTSQYNLGSLFFEMNDKENCIIYLKNSIDGNIELKDYELVIRASVFLSKLYLNNNNISKAEEYLKLVYQYEGLIYHTDIQLNIAQVKIQYLNKKRKYKQAFKLVDSLIIKNINNSYKSELLSLVIESIETLKQLNNNEKLIKYLEYRGALKDSIYNDKIITETLILQTKYDYNNKLNKIVEDNRIKKITQQKDLEFQKNQKWVFIIFTSILGILGVFLYKNLKNSNIVNKELEIKKAEIEKANTELISSNTLVNRQKEELFNINKTLDKYVNILSHDLRSPLSGILLSISNIIDYKDKFTKEQILTKLDKINLTAESIYNLLDELLKFATQINTSEYEPNPISINEVIEKNTSLLNQNFINKDISLHINIKKEIIVNIDNRLIDSVFRNLISNAVKFTKRNGEIAISVNDYNDLLILVSIEDSGIGMSSEQMKNIFSIEKVTTTGGTEGEKGFGFGMILVKENIEKHNCEIWIESEIGKGTKFYFTLPKYIAKN